MKYLFTDLYQDFSCIGGDCTDTCCAGWCILVDDNTYKKYQELDDSTREWICSNIQKNKVGKYEIIKDSRGRCPFLNEKNLCDIILKNSENYISTVCQTYPRKTSQYNDTVFCTVSASCPEVAKALIKRNTQLEFIFTEDKKTVQGIKDWELYNVLINGLIASIEILQVEEIPLGKKYLLLLLLIEELAVAIEQNEGHKVKLIIEKYNNEQYRNMTIDSLQSALLYEMDQWTAISSMLKIFVQVKGDNEERLTLAIAEEALRTLNNDTYIHWKQKYKKFDKEREKENLSVQFMFEYFMDTLNKKSLFNGLVKMYVLILYIQFFEIYVFNTKGELLEKDKIKIISEISRKMEHTKVLSKITDNLMKSDRTKNLIRLLVCLN